MEDTERDSEPLDDEPADTGCGLRLSPLLPPCAVRGAAWSCGRGGGERVRDASWGEVEADERLAVM